MRRMINGTGAILEVSVLCIREYRFHQHIMNLLLFLLPYFACFFFKQILKMGTNRYRIYTTAKVGMVESIML